MTTYQAPTATDLVDPVTHAANVQERERNTERLLAGLRDSNKALTAEVHKLRADIASDETVRLVNSANEELGKYIGKLEAEAEELQAARASLKSTIADLERVVVGKDAELAKMEVMLSEADREWRLRADLQVNDGARLTDLAAKLAAAEARASSAEAELSALRKSMEALACAYDHDGKNGDPAVAFDIRCAMTKTGQELLSPTPAEPDCKGSGKRDEYQVAESAEQCADELEAALGTSKEGR